jgi:hypothetical protein
MATWSNCFCKLRVIARFMFIAICEPYWHNHVQ